MSYTSVFGGTTIYPSDVSYLALALGADKALEWPLESNDPSNPAARVIDVTTSGSYSIVLPDATQTGAGQTILFNNLSPSTNSFTLKDFAGGTIATVGIGEQWQVYLADTTTAAGTWRVFQYGASTATVQASALAGYGLTVTANTLSQSMAVTTFNSSPRTVLTTDRASALVWTGTGIGTLNMLSAASAGNNFFIGVRNSGGGDLTVDAAGSDTIDGLGTLVLRPGESTNLLTDGISWYTLGLGQEAVFAFDYTSITVTGGTYTLAGSELNRIAYKFVGALTADQYIVVPPTIQQYWIDNGTTGAYAFYLQTSGGTPLAIPQGARGIYYCNGVNVVDADTATISLPVSATDGGTGQSSYTTGDMLYANSSTSLTKLSAVVTGNALLSGGVGTAPLWGKIGLTTHVSGTLPVSNGGTGNATLTSNGLLYGNGSSALGVTAAGTTGQVLVGNTGGAPSWAALSGIGVTSLSFGTTGLTPSTATQGAITVAGTLAAANGGTGQSSYTVGDLLYASGATALSKLADVATGNALISGGVGVAPAWGKIDLTTHITGTLGVANGGTGATSLTSGYLLKGNGTSAVSASVVYDDGTNVGIGTSSPSGKLQVISGSSPNAAQSIVGYLGTSANYYDANAHIFRNGAFTEQMRIDASGNLGIGTSSPTYKLDVRSGATATTAYLNSAATTAYNPTGYNGGSARLIMYGGSATGSFTGTQFSHGGSFEAFFGTVQNASGTADFVFQGYSGSVYTERARIDASGNLGLGVTPSAWVAYRAFEMGAGNINSLSTSELNINQNSYYGSGNWTYTANGGATQFRSTGSEFRWYTAPSGTAGNAISFTQAMTLDASGNLGIGTTSPVRILSTRTSSTITARFESTSTDSIIELVNSGTNSTTRPSIGSYNTNLLLSTNGSERARIDSSGNVGIGTSSPLYELDVYKTKTGVVNIAVGNQVGSANDGARFNLNYNGTSIGSYGYTWDGSQFFNSLDYYSFLKFTRQGTEQMRIDASGNLGLGVTPSAWSWGGKVIDGTNNMVISAAGSYLTSAANVYWNGSAWTYKTTSHASMYSQNASQHQWFTAPSGTAGNAISFTQAMTLAASGGLSVGTTTDPGAGNIGLAAGGKLQYSASAYVTPENNVSGAEISTPGAVTFKTGSGPTERARIDSSGNLLVGRTSSSGLGQIQSAAGADLATDSGNVYLCRAGGNVGIGTASPSCKLDVVGSGRVALIGSTSALNAYAGFQYNSTILGYVGNGAGVAGGAGATDFAIGSTGARPLILGTNDAIRMTITSAGDVGIGTSSPGQKLTVVGTVESTSGGFKFPDATTQATKGIAAAFTQITSTSASGTAVTFSNIPQTYTEIYAEITDVSHNGGTSQGLRIQVSTDGVTYTTALNVGPSVAAANSVAGIFSAFDYSRNYVEVSTGVISSANASPYAGFMDSPLLMKITGGIKYVSFVWSGGASFDAGTITLYGR